MKQRSLGIRMRLILSIGVFFTVMVLVFFAFLYPRIRQNISNSEHEKIRIYATSVAANLDKDLQKAMLHLESAASLDALRSLDRERIDPVVLILDSTSQWFIFYQVINASGHVIARPSKPERVGEDRTEHEFFRSTISENRTHVCRLQISPALHYTLNIGTPIRKDTGETLGVLVGAMGLAGRNPDMYQSILEPLVPEGWEVFLASEKGLLIAHSHRTIAGGGNLKELDFSDHPSIRGALRKTWGAEDIEYKQQRWHANSVCVRSTDWTVVVQAPETLILGHVDDVTRPLAVFAGIFLAVLIGAGLLAAGIFIGPLERLTSSLKDYGEKGEVDPTEVKGNDEIADAFRAFNEMIADRKRADTALMESEDRYRTLTNNLNLGVYRNTGGPKGRFIEANPAIVKLFGYDSREEFLELNVSDLYQNPEDRKKFNLKMLQSGSVIDEEELLIKKDGTPFVASISAVAVKDEKGEVKYYDGIVEDVTKRKKMEEALREGKEKYRSILENIEEGYFEVDPVGNMTFVNDALCRGTGYSREELLGMNNRDYTSPETAKNMYQVFNQVYRTGDPAKISGYEIFRKDGERRLYELSAYLMRDRNGTAIGFRGLSRDITERIEAESEKKKLETQLQQAQKMEAIGTLAGGIAHDFNNLLMGIQGRASLMLMDTDAAHPHFEHIKGIEEYVRSAADLTGQLLGFARGGRYEVQPTDLNELIAKQNLMFGRTKKEINIREKFEKKLWASDVDRRQVEQMLLNLYVNAWQAMPGGGDLYIQTENIVIDESYSKPFRVEPGKYVKISITDTGVGMDRETMQKIFEPFFTTKEMGRGTGLGLASAYGIIKNHGGFVNVYSEPGEGATFNLYLPASEKAPIEEKHMEHEMLRGTGTILLVDDQDIILDVSSGIIEKLGYTVLIAKGGKEAMAVCEENRDVIDLVILDMIMPGMGGGETYDRLKEIKPDIKVLLSSGYSINGRAKDILNRGCDGFIQKPFNMGELSKKIREVLGTDSPHK